MKHYLYVLCLAAAIVGLDSCSKSSDPAPEPVVGAWKLDRIRFGGYVAPYTSNNGDEDPAQYGLQNNFTIKSDKTFTGTNRSQGKVTDYSGNWDFTNSTLTLKDDKGNSMPYTLDATVTPNQLLTDLVATTDTLINPTTNKKEGVKINYRFVYTKQ